MKTLAPNTFPFNSLTHALTSRADIRDFGILRKGLYGTNNRKMELKKIKLIENEVTSRKVENCYITYIPSNYNPVTISARFAKSNDLHSSTSTKMIGDTLCIDDEE